MPAGARFASGTYVVRRILIVVLFLLIGWALRGYANPQRVTITGKLLATEPEADSGRYRLSDDGGTPICADPESYLNMYLSGSVGHDLTVTFEPASSNSTR
jgi:hypothetical protein